MDLTEPTVISPDEPVTMQTLGRRDELRGVLAVALAARPDTAATAVITSAVALAEFAVEDAAQREESTLALNAQLFHLALAGHVERGPGRAGGGGPSAARRHRCGCCSPRCAATPTSGSWSTP